jgi:flavin reductase (DIM6/NTAB) family NADH-FMN oxidoreductase RutF
MGAARLGRGEVDQLMIEAAHDILAPLERELWVLTAAAGGRRGGLVATFVTPVSLVREMPRVLVALSVRHNTTDLVRHSSAFALHQLAESDIDWVWRFGLQTGRNRDKLAGLALRTGTTGAPILKEAGAWLECRVEESMETGDRTAFLAAVVDAGARAGFTPLTVRRLREIAPPDKLTRMDELYLRDAAVDAQLIELFRATPPRG